MLKSKLRLYNTTSDFNSEKDNIPVVSMSYDKEGDNLLIKSDIPVSIINIDQSSDSGPVITGDINGGCIRWIRNNSHRYLGKKTADGEMTICQLNDTNSEKYFDGSPANLDGTEGDVFMKLPKFYYTANEGDNIELKFSQSKVGDDWMEWPGNVLIGAFHAVKENRSNVIKSIKLSDSTKSKYKLSDISQEQYLTCTREMGTGYDLVDWNIHCIMAILYLATYGNTDSQKQIGLGHDRISLSESSGLHGYTSSLGMTDTKYEGNQTTLEYSDQNFWGLEDWFGTYTEIMNGMKLKLSEDESTVELEVTNLDGSTRKVEFDKDILVNPDVEESGVVLPYKLKFGRYCDLLPVSNGGLNNKDSTDKIDISSFMNYGYNDKIMLIDGFNSAGIFHSYEDYYIGLRGGSNLINISGIFCCYLSSFISSVSNIEFASRLVFKGNIVESNNVSEFKSI